MMSKGNPSLIAVALLLGLALLGQVVGQSSVSEKRKPAGPEFPIGERLTYRGSVTKAGVTSSVGTVVFRVNQNARHEVTLEARARGNKFGYSLDSKIKTLFRPGEKHPASQFFTQKGSERREKKLLFQSDGTQYWKKKHCKDKNCTNPAHRVKKVNWVGGVLPWGRKKQHCTDSHCGHFEHRVWKLRHSHPVDAERVDLLTAVYRARNLDFTIGAPAHVIPIVNDRDLWDIKVRALKREKVKVAAGTFDCVQLSLEPTPASGQKLKKEFKGLFGMNGAIQIWIDEKTRRPILVKGQVPFAFLNLHARVELAKIMQLDPGK